MLVSSAISKNTLSFWTHNEKKYFNVLSTNNILWRPKLHYIRSKIIKIYLIIIVWLLEHDFKLKCTAHTVRWFSCDSKPRFCCDTWVIGVCNLRFIQNQLLYQDSLAWKELNIRVGRKRLSLCWFIKIWNPSSLMHFKFQLELSLKARTNPYFRYQKGWHFSSDFLLAGSPEFSFISYIKFFKLSFQNNFNWWLLS